MMKKELFKDLRKAYKKKLQRKFKLIFYQDLFKIK